jgi:glycosyltransferase involved in cell wall biosynthesis
MKRIIWQPETKILIDSFKNRSISNDSRGGHTYEYHAAVALSDSYDVIMDENAPRLPHENSLKYWYRLRNSTINGDIFIIAPPIITHGKRRKHAVEIGMLHHIYITEKTKTLKGEISLKVLKRRLRDLDVVVTVSKFWADFLDSIGCQEVRVIYNAFKHEEFLFGTEEVNNFLEKNSMPGDKPIVYIGYADGVKGVIDVFNALKDEDITLVMTGPNTKEINIPVRWLYLNRKDYLLLLNACDVVVNMSKIEEGWSRVAHEALLCRTPVIGSGSGGMKELLQGGGQMICASIADLSDMVREVLNNKEIYVEKGYSFARGFTYETFVREWRALLRKFAP